MQKFFKGTEKRPFTYQTIIEERKGPSNYLVRIIGVLVLILVGGNGFSYFYLGSAIKKEAASAAPAHLRIIYF